MRNNPLVSGNSTVEFVLVFPLLFLLFLAVLDVGLMAVQFISLESACHVLVRKLALSGIPDEGGLADAANAWIAGKMKDPAQIDVRLRSLPTLPQVNPLRQQKEVQVIELTAHRQYQPKFPMVRVLMAEAPIQFKAHAREVRVLALDK